MEYLAEIYPINDLNDNFNSRTAQLWRLYKIIEHESITDENGRKQLLSVLVVYERASNMKLEAGAIVPD